MTIVLTWQAATAAVGILTAIVNSYVTVRKSLREDRRDLHRLADILRRDIFLTYKGDELPKRQERFQALLSEVNPIRDRLWVARGKPLEKR